MDYQEMNSKELCTLLKQKLGKLGINEVDDFNRQTVIAFLKIWDEYYQFQKHKSSY